MEKTIKLKITITYSCDFFTKEDTRMIIEAICESFPSVIGDGEIYIDYMEINKTK